MKITIQTKKNTAIRIDIGYETPFHSSYYWLSVSKEYYDEEGKVEYAELPFVFLKERKFMKLNRKRKW